MEDLKIKFLVTKKNNIFLYEGDKRPFDKVSNQSFLDISLSEFSEEPFAQIRNSNEGIVFQLITLDKIYNKTFSRADLLRFIELMDYLEKEKK